jgi:BMFP domain-containing protein YqiC
MTARQDGGIVNGYADQFMQLGMKASSGENVEANLRELVNKALAHLDIWVDEDKFENKRMLVAQLKRRAGLIGSSNPIQAKVLMDAHDLAASLIAE